MHIGSPRIQIFLTKEVDWCAWIQIFLRKELYWCSTCSLLSVDVQLVGITSANG